MSNNNYFYCLIISISCKKKYFFITILFWFAFCLVFFEKHKWLNCKNIETLDKISRKTLVSKIKNALYSFTRLYIKLHTIISIWEQNIVIQISREITADFFPGLISVPGIYLVSFLFFSTSCYFDHNRSASYILPSKLLS